MVLIALAVAVDWWWALPLEAEARYVGRASCSECHQTQAADWAGSDHDLAMALASDESVLGDFDNAIFSYQGVTSRLFRRNGNFYVHTEGPDGRMADFQIKYTFGIRPLQQYMVEFPDGRVQVLRISWDTSQKRWFYVPPPDVTDERILPGDPLHWTGSMQNWNHVCADCHSTNVHKNYDLATDTFHTTFSEIDVSCEACHGPGSLHVQLAGARSLFWDRRHGYGLARLKGDASKSELDACAKCHARRSQVHPRFTPGSDFLDFYEPERLRESLYHADGQILDEVYVYGSFLQSKMHAHGVRCTDCHNPHSLQLKFPGNRLCTQCHTPGKYDTPAHHHHPVNGAGTQCVDCHMPERTYMVVDPRRDHSFRVPRPDLSIELETPNACNACHTKPTEDARWAAQRVAEWFGPERAGRPSFAPAFAAARQETPDGERQLLKVLRQPKTAPIVRATALELLARYPSLPARQATTQALKHANPLVRGSAVRSLPELTPSEAVRWLVPLLDDPVRTVRMTAARRLVSVPSARLLASEQKSLRRGIKEFEQAQRLHADRAGAHLVLASLYQEQGKLDQAIESLQVAMRLESTLAGPRAQLAALLTQTGGSVQKIKSLREAEIELLSRDVRLVPENAALRVQYGLMLHFVGRSPQAIEQLEEACRLQANSYDYRMLLAELYVARQQWEQAQASVQILLDLRPGDPTAQRMLDDLSRRRERE